jgi:hypothetical protein
MTLEQRQAKEERDAAKEERAWLKQRARLLKIARGAELSRENDWVCLTFPNGQVYKCRGNLVDDTFGRGE